METALKNYRSTYPQYNNISDEDILWAYKQKHPQYGKLSDDDLKYALEQKYTQETPEPKKSKLSPELIPAVTSTGIYGFNELLTGADKIMPKEAGTPWAMGKNILAKMPGSMMRMVAPSIIAPSPAHAAMNKFLFPKQTEKVSGAIESVMKPLYEGYEQKVDEKFQFEQPLGKYARGPKTLGEFFDPVRLYQVAASQGPQMAAFVGAVMIDPAIATMVMYGAEGGESQRGIEEYEKKSGKKVDTVLKSFIPVAVGSVNAALERVGLKSILKVGKIPGLSGKIIAAAIATATEGIEEGLQEVVQILSERGYNKEAEGLLKQWQRVWHSIYGGLVLGAGGSLISGASGKKGQPEIDSKELEQKGREIVKEIEKDPSIIDRLPIYQQQVESMRPPLQDRMAGYQQQNEALGQYNREQYEDIFKREIPSTEEVHATRQSPEGRMAVLKSLEEMEKEGITKAEGDRESARGELQNMQFYVNNKDAVESELKRRVPETAKEPMTPQKAREILKRAEKTRSAKKSKLSPDIQKVVDENKLDYIGDDSGGNHNFNFSKESGVETTIAIPSDYTEQQFRQHIADTFTRFKKPELAKEVLGEKEPPKPEKAKVKEPWEMTKSEYIDKFKKMSEKVGGWSKSLRGDFTQRHKNFINQALSEGKTPYEGWEKDYPDLVKEKPKPKKSTKIYDYANLIRQYGGLKMEGDLAGEIKRLPNHLKNKNGKTIDQMAEILQDEGYDIKSTRDLLDKIRNKEVVESQENLEDQLDKENKAREKAVMDEFQPKKISPKDLGEGDKVKIMGEEFKVVEKTEGGVRLKDHGPEILVDSDESLEVDKGKIKKADRPSVETVKEPSKKAVPVKEQNIEFVEGGDAIGKEYHGYIQAKDSKTGKNIGRVDYSYFQGKTKVKMIEVQKEYQRKGVGTQLLNKLQEQSDNEIGVQGNFATKEGKALWDKFTGVPKQAKSSEMKSQEKFTKADFYKEAGFKQISDAVGMKPPKTVKTPAGDQIVSPELLGQAKAPTGKIKGKQGATLSEQIKSLQAQLNGERKQLNTMSRILHSGIVSEKTKLRMKELTKSIKVLDGKIKKLRTQENLFEKPPEEEKGMFDKFKSEEGAIKVTSEDVQEAFDKGYSFAVDRLDPIRRMVKEIAETESGIKGQQLATAKDAYIWARLFSGWQGVAQHFLEKGTLNSKRETTGKGLKQILKPIEKKLDEWKKYAIYKRTLELNDRFEKKTIEELSGLDMTEQQIRNEIARMDKENPQFKEVTNEVYKYQDSLLRWMGAHGMISKELYQRVKALNKYYIPFFRMMEKPSKKGTGKSFANIPGGVKRIKGSKRQIIDPLESIIKNTFVSVNLGLRNKVGSLIADYAETEAGKNWVQKYKRPVAPIAVEAKEVLSKLDGDFSNIEDLEETIVNIFRPQMIINEPNTVMVWKDGKRQFYKLDPELYKAVTGLHETQSHWLIKLLSFPARTLRAGATLTPEFMGRNPMRDNFTAFVYSKYGFKPGVDFVRGLFHVIKRDKLFWEFKSSGADHSMIVSMDRNYLRGELNKIMKTKVQRIFGKVINPIEVLRGVSEAMEQATRMGEFEKGLKKEGKTLKGKMRSGLAAKEVTLDFGRRGQKPMQDTNRIIAFFNAQIQGADKLVRTFTNPKTRGKALIRALAGITLPSIALWLINHDDDDYKDMPRWQKDFFWLVKIPGFDKVNLFGDNFLRIPKPFELGIIFGSLPERILDWSFENDKEAMSEWTESAIDGILPEFWPTAVKPIAENLKNYDFFYDKPIVPPYLDIQNIEERRKYSARTSEAAKLLGDKINVSPAKIENVFLDYFGGMGRYSLQGADYLLSIGQDKPPKPTQGLSGWPGIKGFVARYPTSNTRNIVKFEKQFQIVEEKRNTFKNHLKYSPDKADAYYQKWSLEIDSYEYMKNMNKTLTGIRKQISVIYESKTMTPNEKRKEIDIIYRSMTDLARDSRDQIQKMKR